MRQQRTSKTPRRCRRQPEAPPFDAQPFQPDTAAVDALLARIDHVLEAA